MNYKPVVEAPAGKTMQPLLAVLMVRWVAPYL
jgi:hypothetical protein